MKVMRESTAVVVDFYCKRIHFNDLAPCSQMLICWHEYISIVVLGYAHPPVQLGTEGVQFVPHSCGFSDRTIVAESLEAIVLTVWDVPAQIVRSVLPQEAHNVQIQVSLQVGALILLSQVAQPWRRDQLIKCSAKRPAHLSASVYLLVGVVAPRVP